MRRSIALHLPTVRGRARNDRALLLLTGLVASLTVGLTTAVAPATEQAADRAMAATVREAGPSGAVVATLPEWYDDPRGKVLDPTTAVQLRQDADYASSVLPGPLAAVLRPGTTSVTTPPLQLLDSGPGRSLQLVYVDTAGAAPDVGWTDGGPPGASADVGDDAPGPVQVGLSEEVAEALGLHPGDRVPVKDEAGRTATIEVSGTFAATDEDAAAWQVAPRMLHPVEGTADGIPFTSATALVSAESLPDLRFALPGDDLTRRVVLTPEPDRVRWRTAATLEQAVATLQSSAGPASGDLSWDSQLASVLQQGRAQVASARGQAQVLLVTLLSCALLVLALAAQLLVARRTSALAMVRQRGASLAGIAAELLLEGLAAATAATALGLGAAHVLAGGVAWWWSVPVLVVAAVAPAVLGAVVAAGSADARKAPANRSARRAVTRSRQLRRLAVEAALLTAAVLSFTALQQRGVADPDGGGGELTTSSAPVWWSVVGAVVLLRLLPLAWARAVRLARRTTGSVGLVATARLALTGARVLPVVITVVATAGITLGLAMSATVREGQAEAARVAVGGDARLVAEPDAGLTDVAQDVADASGVRAAAAGRVEDGVRVSSSRAAAVVRLVVVDHVDYGRLLDATGVATAGLTRLTSSDPGPAPALVRGGGSDLVGDLAVVWDDARVPLTVVGVAPDVDGADRPVVVVDAEAFAAAGGVAPPNTVWAAGPGGPAAVEAAATDVDGVDSVVTYADELGRRRDAPLASALAILAVGSSVLLLALAGLATVLSAVAGAPPRGEALGRLRALGLPVRDVRRILLAELTVPVAIAAVAGAALGAGCSIAVLDALSLELVTGQPGAPSVVVPWWSALSVTVLVAAAAVVVAVLELRAIRRRTLARLLRS